MNPQSRKTYQAPLNKASGICQICHAKDVCMASFLQEDELVRFNDIVGRRLLMNRGERVFMAGDNLQSIFVLHSGSVKSYIDSIDGVSQITGFHMPGDIIGLHGVANQVHSDTVETLETSSVCEVRFDNFDELITNFPGLRKGLLRYVFREMDHEQELLLVLGKMSAERRVAHFLLDLSNRMSERGLSGEKIQLTMTRHDIGNYLGLAVETVSRVFSKFQTKGVVNVKRRSIHITNILALRAVMEQSGDQPLPSKSISNSR